MEMSLNLLSMVYIFRSLIVLRERVLMLMTSTTETFLTAKLLRQGYRYHKIQRAFSKFYHRHSELIVKYIIGLKTLLQQGISEPIIYSDLVYKFKRIAGKPNFSYTSNRLSNLIKKKVGYNLDIMQQSACIPEAFYRIYTL